MTKLFERITGHLRHETTTGIQLREMDAFRGWAVLGVFALHCTSNMDYVRQVMEDYGSPGLAVMFVLRQGWAGLDLFFFISGFLLFLKFGKAFYRGQPSPSKKAFFLRRFKRIAPAYYANLVLLLILGGGLVVAPVLNKLSLWDVISHFLFFFNMFPEYSRTVNYVFWTLAIEAQFYLVLPFIAGWFCGKRWAVALPAVLVLSGLYKLWATGLYVSTTGIMDIAESQIPFNQLIWRIDEFAIGICFANLWLYLQRTGNRLSFLTESRYANFLAIIGLALPLPILMARRFGWLDMYVVAVLLPLLLSLAFGMVITGTLYSSGWIKRVIANPAIEFIGIISYSVYLWHLVIIKTLIKYFPALNGISIAWQLALVGVSLVVTVSVGLGSYLVFERPFLKRGKLRWPARLRARL